MAVLVPNRYSSTAASIWKSARGRAGTLRAAAVVRADAMAGITADHETATLLLLDVGTARADASNPGGSQAAQLGRNSVICLARRCGRRRLPSFCGTSGDERR